VDSGDFIDLWGIYREFRRTVFEEVDFAHEAANAQRFRNMFKDDPTIYIPHVYEQYVTRRIIVLEWIDGIKINDYAILDAFEIDRLEVARRTVNAYFHQFFEEGFFHADPHPGNIFVKCSSPPNQPVIAFLDFGMTGSIANYTRRFLRELFLAIVARDTHTVVQTLIKLGFIGEGANLVSIERAMDMLMDQYIGITLGQFRELQMSNVARDIVDLLYGQPFHIPAHFAFSGRAVSTLVGVATGLAPNFNFIEEATPYARRFLGLDTQNLSEMVQEIIRQLIENGRVMSTLPRTVERFMTHIQTGQVEVRLANFLDKRSHRIPVSIAGSGFSMALISLSSLAGGIYLTNIHLYTPGWFCLGLAGITTLSMIVRR
jgi:predicted unusual protein kinase regulating ubiquinone biosynthesis (AarF/ABC1/UbiB family)